MSTCTARRLMAVTALGATAMMGFALADDYGRRDGYKSVRPGDYKYNDYGLYDGAAKYDSYGRYDRADPRYDQRYDARYDRGPGRDFDRGAYRGIDGARAAHARYTPWEAERLDGDCERNVRIEWGETLSDIANYCDVPVAAIIDANPRLPHPRYIPAGEIIRIPPIKGGIYDGANRLSYNGRWYRDDYLAAGALESDNRGQLFYTIRPGDTLAQISWEFDVPLWTLRDLNPHMRPRALEIGDRVYLPAYVDEAPSRRKPGWRAASYRDGARFDPMVSIYPRRGPRDGEILIVGDGFDRGGRVEIMLGRPGAEMTRIEVVEADGDGRISERLRLPPDYAHDEAYWAMRPSRGDYVMSEPYAIDRSASWTARDGRRDGWRSEWRGGPRDDWRDDWRGEWREGDRRPGASPGYAGDPQRRNADLEVLDRRGDGVSLIAAGFPPESTVSFYAGSDARNQTLVGRAKANFRGEARLEARGPAHGGRDGKAAFTAIATDRYGVRYEARERERVDGGRGYGAAAALNNAERARVARMAASLDGRQGFFDRMARAPVEAFRQQDLVAGPHVVAVDRVGYGQARAGAPAPRGARIVGILTDTRGDCAFLRDDGGRTVALEGALRGYKAGDRVVVDGDFTSGRNARCGAETLRVASIDWAPL